MSDRLAVDIARWFATGNVGASSKAIACQMLGVQSDKSHPHDPSDFNRCLMFLYAVPEARERLQEMRGVSPTWARLVDRWKEIEAIFIAEVGVNWSRGDTARKTFDLMQKILHNE